MNSKSHFLISVHSLRQGPLKKVSLRWEKLLTENLIQFCAFCGDIFWLWCVIWVASVHSCNSFPAHWELCYQNILDRFWMAQICAVLFIDNTAHCPICLVCSGGNPRHSPKVDGKMSELLCHGETRALPRGTTSKRWFCKGKTRQNLEVWSWDKQWKVLQVHSSTEIHSSCTFLLPPLPQP